jgi:Ca2+/Na+ antiporter
MLREIVLKARSFEEENITNKQKVADLKNEFGVLNDKYLISQQHALESIESSKVAADFSVSIYLLLLLLLFYYCYYYYYYYHRY